MRTRHENRNLFLATLLALASGCQPEAVVESEPLPPADFGRKLPVQAPQSYGDFQGVAWDLEHNAVVAVEHPHQSLTTILSMHLDEPTASTLVSAPAGAVELRTSDMGMLLFTSVGQSSGAPASLNKADGSRITSTSRVQFALSDNGKWVVYQDDQWQLLELATGARTALPRMIEAAIAVTNDGSRVAFGNLRGGNVVRIVTVATGKIDSLMIPGSLYDVAFSGSQLHALIAARDNANGKIRLFFIDLDEGGDITSLGGMEIVPDGGPGAATCGAWSHGNEPRTAVVGVVMHSSWDLTALSRIDFVRLGDTIEVIARADVWAATDCSVSPDGRWFVYGAATGYINTGRLYLKKIR